MSLNISRNERFMQMDDPASGERTIFACDTISLEDLQSPGQALSVFADEIVVGGTVRSGGYPIRIFCRSIKFLDSGLIDTSGREGLGFGPEDIPLAGPNAGAAGIDGAPGKDGLDGGMVEICFCEIMGKARVKANGGNGGNGQPGGNGRMGAAGIEGGVERVYGLPTVEPVPRTSPATGGDGGIGGARGLPGKGGNGGNGGTILIQSVSSFPQTEWSSTGGQAGKTREAGTPGLGGIGGAAGTVVWYDCHSASDGPGIHGGGYRRLTMKQFKEKNVHLNTRAAVILSNLPQRNSQLSCEEREHHMAQSGRPGASGDERLAELAAITIPNNGIVGVINEVILPIEKFGEKFPLPFVEMLLNATEDQYRIIARPQSSDQELAARIEFLLIASSVATSNDHTRASIYARAFMMASRLRLGLDFFGYGTTSVPLISFESYKKLIDETLIPQAQIIDDAFKKYFDKNLDEKEVRSNAAKALAQAKSNNLRLSSRLNETATATKIRLAEIAALESEMRAAYDILLAARNDLANAVEKKNEHKCNYVDTLISVATIVAAVSTGGTAIVGAVGATGKLVKDYQDNTGAGNSLWDARKILTEDLKDLGKEATTVAESVEKVRKALHGQSLTPMAKPQLAMARSEIDRMVAEYVGMPEAESYRQAGYHYVGICESRNQAILDYNGLLTIMEEIRSMLVTSAQRADKAQSDLALAIDPGAASIVSFMGRARRESLADVTHFIHLENRALNYLLGAHYDLSLSAFDIGSISYAHSEVNARWNNALDEFRAIRKLESTWKISIKDFVSNKEWERFINATFGDQSIGFTIRYDNPKYRHLFQAAPLLRITGIKAELPGAEIDKSVDSSEASIPWALSHGGTELIFAGDEDIRQFVHRVVQIHGLAPVSENGASVEADFSQNGFFAGVSPFASWNFALLGTRELGINLKNLDDIKLVLAGYFVET